MVIAMPPSGDTVAQVLGIKRRRLRERLEAEGTSIKVVLEEMRCELARRHAGGDPHADRRDRGNPALLEARRILPRLKAWTGQTPRRDCGVGVRLTTGWPRCFALWRSFSFPA
jgi:hypothetical protein